jgi:hypothetical protein
MFFTNQGANAMAIIAAQIESNGWVLCVTMGGSPGSFATYALDPDGVPKLTLASTHPGFVKAGNTAVPGSYARMLLGTKPLRLPVNPASPTTPVIDETDLGGGLIRVRIALSDWVYPTDTGLRLSVAAGWRTGEAAQSGIAVTNNSTLAAPIPIMRWVLPSYDVTTGAFRLSLIVGSHHPVGFEPVAGVKFTATDGANTKTVWTTTLGTDNSYGDNLRCYTAMIDPVTAIALTAGLLRCDAEVYPWLGAMRSTDVAGTRDCSVLASAGLATQAAAPFVIGYDPAGTRYSNAFVYVDPAGTTTPSAAMVATTLAGAKAVAPALRAANISVGVQAGYLANRTLAAANGGASAARSVDGLQIVLAPGTHAGAGALNATTGITATEIPVCVIGDPEDASPRANCILQTGTSPNLRVPRLRLRNLMLQCGTTPLVASSTSIFWIDGIEIRGKAGLETNTVTPLSSGSPAPGTYSLSITNCKIWKTGWVTGAANLKNGLMRATQHSRYGFGSTLIKNRFIPATEDTTITGQQNCYQMVNDLSDIGSLEDVVVAYNDGRNCTGIFLPMRGASAAVAGTLNTSYRRHLILGNLVERIGPTTSNLGSYGEDTSATMSYIIHEGNSMVGERWNAYYSDPLPTTNDANATSGVDGQYNDACVTRVANNFHDWQPSKQDDFNDPTSMAVRGTSNGYRPHMIHAWGPHYGVGSEGNFEAGRAGASHIGVHEYFGLRSRGYGATDTALDPQFVDDRSTSGAGGGGGDYTPRQTSPLNGRVLRGNTDRDIFGTARMFGGAAGAIEPMGSVLPVALEPAAARSDQRVAGTVVRWIGLLSPQGTALPDRATATLIGVDFSLSPAGARSSQAAGASIVGAGSFLAPASVWHGTQGSVGSVEVTGVAAGPSLLPDVSKMQLLPAPTLLFPDGAVAALHTLFVHADLRTSFVK